MPLSNVITKLPNIEVYKIQHGFNAILYAKSTAEVFCIHCGGNRLRIKDKFVRKVKSVSVGVGLTTLHLDSHKFHCKDCGRYFNQRFEGILPRKRSSEPFRREVVQKHHDGTTQKRLSDRLRIATATVEKWYQEFMELEVRKFKRSCPPVLGIDEHFFTKRKGYATTIADLSGNKVFDVTLGRSQGQLKNYLNKLQGRDQVKVIVMDLSETYRSIARKYFENALIVADRFHVIRLINHYFMKVWKLLDEAGRANRGLLSLMRRHEHKLKPSQQINLRSYLRSIPGLEAIYDFKQRLCKLMGLKTLKAREFRKVIPELLTMIRELKTSGFEDMKRLGKTLWSWREEIGRMMRFSKTNSITEGLHNKMEMISRRAFGFRNFENYRMRVKVNCGYTW